VFLPCSTATAFNGYVLWLAIPRCVKGTLDAAPYLQFPGIIQDCCNNIIPASGAIAGPILLLLMTTPLLVFAARSCLALVGEPPWLGWVLRFDCGLPLIGSQARRTRWSPPATPPRSARPASAELAVSAG
jgi:hypothetical protein